MKSIPMSCLALLFFLIGSSFILFTIVLIVFDFTQPSLDDVIGQSVPLNPDNPDPALQGQFVSVTGRLSTTAQLSDDLYFKPAPYLELTRQVEMYAWVQRSRKANSTSAYDQYWTEDWSNSPPNDTRNPEMTIKNSTWRIPDIQIGVYTVKLTDLDLPTSETVEMSADMLKLSDKATLSDDYIFMGQGSLDSPQIGDLRLWYEGVPLPDKIVTVYGQLDGKTIRPYPYGSSSEVYHVRVGDRETTLTGLSQEAIIATWLFRCFSLAFVAAGLGFIVTGVAFLYSAR